MAGRIPEETIQEIRDRIDLADLVGRHVSLRKSGRGYTGLCPFHQEKTPSFHVHPERGIFHCYGCGEGGNAFAFLMRQENLTFPEAVRSLAAECGVVVPVSGGGESGVAERVLGANEVAQRLYREALAASMGAEARAYLGRRGLDDELVGRFGIGFAPSGWDSLTRALSKRGIAPDVGERAGLLRPRTRGGHYDLLRDRITFPIQDVRGRVVAFGGRALAPDAEPKYLNSPETPVFRKREAFYGFPHALEPIRRAERAVVVEGYFDLLALHRAGVGEVLATCGTALTEGHARNLRRRTRKVVLLYDGDEAGRRAALRALEALLPQGLRVHVAALPSGEDPDDLLTKRGADALRSLVDAAPLGIDLAIERALERGCARPAEKADAVASVAPLVAAIPDPAERGAFAQRLGLAVGIDPADAAAAVRRVARGEAPEQAVAPIEVSAGRLETPLERRLADVAAILLAHPPHAEQVVEAELMASVPPGPFLELLPGLLERCRREEVVDLGALAEKLGSEATRLLHDLAVRDAERFEDRERAGRALEDTTAWLRRRRFREEANALNRRFDDRGVDGRALLAEKQRQLERLRAASESSPG